MISYESILKYREQFPHDKCFFSEPGTGVMLTSSAGKAFISPPTEDDAIFMDRLERCQKEKRNLFYDEWDLFTYKKNILY